MAKVTPGATKTAKPTKPAKEKKPARPGFEAKELLEVAVPEGFNFDEFKPLKKKAFKTEAVFFDHAAAYFDWKAAGARKKADDARKYGDKSTRNNVKKLEKGVEKMKDLIKTLRAQGMDVSGFEAKLNELIAASNEPAAAAAE